MGPGTGSYVIPAWALRLTSQKPNLPLHGFGFLCMHRVPGGLIKLSAPTSSLASQCLPSATIKQLGLGSISVASSDRQSRTIDVHHERTSIAELDTAPPTSIVFPTPKTQKNLPYSLKWQRRWGGDSRPPLKLYHDRYYRAQ